MKCPEFRKQGNYFLTNERVSCPLPIWILTGPTASGKTDVALSIAESIHAEIISADSMLVYRGMDIGTEKPSAAMQHKIPHHLIDIIDPWEEYSVGRYVKDFEHIAKIPAPKRENHSSSWAARRFI